MKITLFVLAAFICVQIATAASKSKGGAEKATEAKEVSVEASAEAKASVEASASAEKSEELSGSLKKKGKSGVEKSGSLSVEKNESEEAPVNLGWKEILEQITAILECLKEGKDLKSALKLKEGGKISILEKLKEKVALALESIEKGKGIGDLSKVSEDMKIVKEIQEKLVLIAQLLQKGKDVSGLLDVEATVKIISELKASIEKLLSASANLAAEESKKLQGGLLSLLKGKGLLDLDLIKSVAPIIAELQKKGIELGALDLKNIGAIDIPCIQKTIEKVTTALKGGADIQSILAGAEKFGISVPELKGLQGVLGLVGKLVEGGALSLKSLLNLQGGASIINIKKLLPLPLL
ncbi:hypothetical protein K0M31_000208 [Melipona bicolor]|uniref:Uncharacterized protein n=1 Tax=Melipona bicolor TaxID=60889 RepID=A0AA40KWF3_9HYME|nr:hypothetical protein K0M31_000208 [Melipona bicolor]